KPYDEEADGSNKNETVFREWSKLLPADRIAHLPDPARVVDVIFGILANETNRIEYFQEELTGRQKPAQVKTVFKALQTVHQIAGTGSLPKIAGPGHSVTRTFGPPGKSTKSLLE